MPDEPLQRPERNTLPIVSTAVPPEPVARWRRLARLRNIIIAIWLGGLACDLIGPFALTGLFPAWKTQALGLMFGLMVIWFSACVAGLVLQGSLDRHFEQTLRRNDVSCLGCWIDTLFSPVCKGAYPQSAGKHYEAARAGLLEQLPLLTEDTAHLLRVGERLTLFKTLREKDGEVIRVVLRTVTVFADARAVPFVRYLAEGKGLAATDTELRSLAETTLGLLRNQLNLSSGARGLLRGAQPPRSPKEELLTPTHMSGEAEREDLLRAENRK